MLDLFPPTQGFIHTFLSGGQACCNNIAAGDTVAFFVRSSGLPVPKIEPEDKIVPYAGTTVRRRLSLKRARGRAIIASPTACACVLCPEYRRR